MVPIPCFDRASGDRGMHDLLCYRPHEALAREAGEVDMSVAMERWVKPPNYDSHPVVRRWRGRAALVVPVALYLDAAEYAIRDSMLVVSMTNLLTGRKHVIAVLRKRLLCGHKAGCGCKGWCSLFPLWLFLKWSLDALNSGLYLTARHNTELDGDKLSDRVEI